MCVCVWGGGGGGGGSGAHMHTIKSLVDDLTFRRYILEKPLFQLSTNQTVDTKGNLDPHLSDQDLRCLPTDRRSVFPQPAGI